MGISRQEYWQGLPFPSPGNLTNPGIKPTSPESPALAGRFFTAEPPRKPHSKLTPNPHSTPTSLPSLWGWFGLGGFDHWPKLDTTSLSVRNIGKGLNKSTCINGNLPSQPQPHNLQDKFSASPDAWLLPSEQPLSCRRKLALLDVLPALSLLL